MPGIAMVAFRVYFCKAETKHKNPLKIPQTEKKNASSKTNYRQGCDKSNLLGFVTTVDVHYRIFSIQNWILPWPGCSGIRKDNQEQKHICSNDDYCLFY